MKLTTICFLAGLCLTAGNAGAQNKPAPAPDSPIIFSILNVGFEVKGTMKILRADIHFDAKNLAQSTIAASADPATINTGITIRDNHLKRADYFNIEKYHEVRLQSTAFRKAGRRYTGYFDLTIKGITRQVIIYFTRTPNGNFVLFTGSFEINRLDFNLGEKSTVLDENVKIRISFLADENNPDRKRLPSR